MFVFRSAKQLSKLEAAMDRIGGWTPELIDLLVEGDTLAQVRDIVLGISVAKRVDLFVHPLQKYPSKYYVNGGDIHRILTETGIIDSCLGIKDAEEMIKNGTIPESWNGKNVCLWKNVRRDLDDPLGCLRVFIVPIVVVNWAGKGKTEIIDADGSKRWDDTYPAAIAKI